MLPKYKWRHDSILQYIAALLRPSLADGFVLLVDLPRHTGFYSDFPADVCITAFRPDILLLNRATRTICLIELTVPAEENILKACDRKRGKYKALITDLQENGYNAELFTIEVGSRGNFGTGFSVFLRLLAASKVVSAFTTEQMNNASTIVSQLALRCSFWIYLTRRSSDFAAERPLLVL